ncbi:MAG: hypothetical protein ACLPVO_13995 [Desulfomonilaceae bacterium]
MIAAVTGLPQEILNQIEYREWSLRTLEGVSRFKELKVKSLPALAINGKLIYECLIPPTEDLIAVIENSMLERTI